MQQIPSSQAKNEFGSIIQSAQKNHAIEITKRGKPVAVVVSPDHYNRMGGDRARLRAVIDSIQEQATANGLTPEMLHSLLYEEK